MNRGGLFGTFFGTVLDVVLPKALAKAAGLSQGGAGVEWVGVLWLLHHYSTMPLLYSIYATLRQG